MCSSDLEDDVRWFIANPGIMFCSDGELHGAHPGGGAVTPTVSFRAFDPGTKKWVLLASLSGCIMRASFLGTGNNFSCVVFRKEKNREFPGSSRLESY